MSSVHMVLHTQFCASCCCVLQAENLGSTVQIRREMALDIAVAKGYMATEELVKIFLYHD